MKLFTFVVLAVMLVGVTVQAAEVPTSKGDKAMVFDFDGLANLDLDGYHSWGVGLRYYIADMTAVRVGVIFGSESQVWEADEEGYSDEENNWSMYGVEAVYEKHLEAPCASVSPYWGVGVGFEMSSDEWIYAAGYEGGTCSSTDKSTAFNVFGALGFEWAFTNCLTLGGEYRAGFLSESGETETDNSGGDRTDTCCKWTDTEMGFSEASVYLSVYF